MNFAKTRKSLFFFCFLASAALHVGGIWLLYANPLKVEKAKEVLALNAPPAPRLIPKDPEVMLVEKMESALEQSLNEVVALAHQLSPHSDIAQDEESSHEMDKVSSVEKPRKSWISLPEVQEDELCDFEGEETAFAATLPPLFDPEMEAFFSEFALDNERDEIPLAFETKHQASVTVDQLVISEQSPALVLIRDDYTLTDDQFAPSALPTSHAEKLSHHFFASLEQLKKLSAEEKALPQSAIAFNAPTESTSSRLILPSAVDYLRNQWIKRSLAEQTLPAIEEYGIDEISHHLSFHDEVGVDVKIMNDPETNRYIFSLTIHPDFESECEVINQNFYFLIDRSNSIEPHKFARFKRAVQRSLAALRDDDKFNICIFDKKVVKLSDEPLPVTERTLQRATDFLDSEKSKTRFAANDLFDSLETILPKNRRPDEMHSVILITDGNTLLKGAKQKKELSKWANKHQHQFNFYTAAAGKGNNLVMLDMLGYITGGKLLYSDTNAGLPRKLVRLIKELHNPIAKNLTVEIAAKDTNATVILQPQTQKLPPMFVGKSYEIVGTMDEMCDLTLYLQGQNHDRWINVRKDISFRNADIGGRSLEKLWAHVQSKVCYEHFLQNGKNTHLKEAKEIVSPYNGVIAME